ncbi:mechanosensitive ion channel family protein [Streptomyces sp. NBC_00091]|uniref:mechanosensitive ion channel family protein n=1 Tax=Streptomyces sp. NBC_00091 TaxID=2975648 RepID=UPI00224CD40B|nr:mechanosensitive ion channel domain-containing protein [Streptomyces sp. NBC_00091]MCX5378864.1 mechanosensitive ion channel family protein [Streptomyces sp. NBC_00091]
MENVLRPVTVVCAVLVLTLLAGWLLDLLLRKADARHTETPLWGLLRRCGLPFRLVLGTAALQAAYRPAGILPAHSAAVGHALTLVQIASTAWLLVGIAAAVVEATYARYAADHPDEARVRRVRTQVTLIQRVLTALAVVVAAAAMLLTFPPMRTVGASMLASAGVLGIVAGIAAQASLGNLFAGLQIAFGDTVRIGDTVVVDKEWGKVEEITLTFLVVRTWDERRITMPVSYFTSKPYENWSRGGAQMTGTVFWHLDHSAPIALMRDKLAELLKDIPEWDGRTGSLAVTDTTPHTIVVRAVVTAKDADDVWTLRCAVREQLIAWLTAQHPYALPRVTTTEAAPRG